MAKLYAAAVFAFIAAMVIVITGLSSDARGITVFFRSIVGFVSAGLMVYIVLKILAARDIMDIDAFVEAKDEKKLVEAATSSAEENSAEDGQAMADEAETTEKEDGPTQQFEPLNSAELTRMKSPD